MTTSRTLFGTALFLAIVMTPLASAAFLDPIPYWCGYNGHTYQLVRTDYDLIAHPENGWCTWEEANVLAASSYYRGVQGHLVSITSASEQSAVSSSAFLGSAISLYGDLIWIGGYQDLSSPDYAEPDGGWTWVTDEPWGTYTNWDGGTPRNRWGGENYAMMSGGQFNVGVWVDATNVVQPLNAKVSYVIEYPVEYVPEPTTVCLLAIGGLLILKRRG